jgi:hypothetical protein
MRLPILSAIAAIALFAFTSAPEAVASPNGGGAASSSTGTPPAPATAKPKGERVAPGETKTNPDGVKVTNPERPESKGDVYLDPKPGTAVEGDVESTVTCRPKSKPTIEGIDATDKVIVNRQSEATVKGTGGEVILQSGGKVTVTAEKGGGSIVVRPSAGPPTTVHPGSTVTVG